MESYDEGCEARREGEISVMMESMGKAIELLHERVNQLSERVNPILRTDPPSSSKKQCPEPIQSITTALALSINVHIGKIIDIRKQVDNLISRCEI